MMVFTVFVKFGLGEERQGKEGRSEEIPHPNLLVNI